MTAEADQYLRSVLALYTAGPMELAGAQRAFQAVSAVVRQWGVQYLRAVLPSGSFAKGTHVRGRSDMDIFLSIRADTPGTLADMYGSLHQFAKERGWNPRKQNVSIGATVLGVSIDLVPGRVYEGSADYHSLYKSKSNSWLQTNIEQQIAVVRQSRRTEEIRLAKVWRHLNRLDFPSFYLEMVTLRALNGRPHGQVSQNCWEVLRFFADDLVTARIVDPSNSNNVLSEDLSPLEKQTIAAAARVTRSKATWGEIVW